MTRNHKTLMSLFILLLTIAVPATASRVRRLTLDEVRDRADRIIIGEVIGVSTRLAPTGQTVFTDYEVRVREQLAGEYRPVTIVSISGGEAGGLGVAVPGVPQLQVGKQYVFFLYKGNPVPVPTVGWGQGLFEITDVRVGGEQRQVLISTDGVPLEMSADQKLMRGPVVMVNEGVLTVYEPEPARDATKRAGLVAVNADGSIAPSANLPIEHQTTTGLRQYASVDDLRAFVHRQIESIGPKNQ